MRYYHWMLLAPLPAWIVWGAAVNLYPQHALDWFPYFWTLSDIGILLAILGLVLWSWNYSTPAKPKRHGVANEGTNGTP